MIEKIRFIGLGLFLAMAGCAQMGHFLAALDTKPQLEAWGPGVVFLFFYLQASSEQDTQRMRSGTIYSVDEGYSYGEIHVAKNLLEYRIAYPLKPNDVARFHMYPIATDHGVNRGNERASQADRRSVAVTDPQHRPLFILHPSLVVREYRGRNDEVVAVADLRRPKRVILLAGE